MARSCPPRVTGGSVRKRESPRPNGVCGLSLFMPRTNLCFCQGSSGLFTTEIKSIRAGSARIKVVAANIDAIASSRLTGARDKSRRTVKPRAASRLIVVPASVLTSARPAAVAKFKAPASAPSGRRRQARCSAQINLSPAASSNRHSQPTAGASHVVIDLTGDDD